MRTCSGCALPRAALFSVAGFFVSAVARISVQPSRRHKMAKESSSVEVDFEANVNKKLQSLNDRQDSIQTMSLWVIHHKAHCNQIAAAWISAMKKAIPAKKRLTLFYLLNDVLQNCKRKNAKIYLLAFKPFLKDAILCVRTPDIRQKVERILSIWEERGVFTQDYTNELKDVLIRGEEGRDCVTDQLIDNFKPGEFSAAITELKRYEDEVALKHKQLLQVHLDATSAEATKALKDRTNSKQFALQFEESCVKMEEYVAALQKEIKDRTQFTEKLEQAQLFYETQWNESQVVVKAYKNFGIRVKNLKKRLDEYMASRQEDDASSSPVPLSAVTDAPSPGNTPPPDPSQDNVESIDMDLSDEESGIATGGIVTVSPVKAKTATADVASAAGSKLPTPLQPPVTAVERQLFGSAQGTRPPSTAAQLLQPPVTASAPIVSPVAVSKPAVYDPRQAYNPAYHLQPKPVVPPAATAGAAAPIPTAALAAAVGSHGPPQAEGMQLNKALGTLSASGRAAPSGVPPPLPPQPPLPPTAAAPATAAPAAASSTAALPGGSSPSGGPANPGIELLRKLINQAGASPSQNTSVLESLTSFALTVKALTAPKKDEGGSAAATAAATPATWSDWKKKQTMEQEDEDGSSAPVTTSTAGAAPPVGLAMSSTLLQPQRPVPPAMLDRIAAGLPAAYPNLPGTFLPRVNSFPTAAEAAKLGALLPAGIAPLAPPPPLPALLSNRMVHVPAPGAGPAVPAAAAATAGAAAPQPLAGLPPLLPPLPPAGMHPPPFDVPTLLPPTFPFERQLPLLGHYVPPLMPPLPELEKGSALMHLREQAVGSPPPLPVLAAQATGGGGAPNPAHSPPPLASPAVQAVLARLKLPLAGGGRPAAAAAVGEDPAVGVGALTAHGTLGLAASLGAAAVAPSPTAAAAAAPFHFSVQPSSPLAGLGALGSRPPTPTVAAAEQAAAAASSSSAAAAALLPIAAALPPAIMAVLTSGLSRSKEAAAAAPSAASALLLPPTRPALPAEPPADDAHRPAMPMEVTADVAAAAAPVGAAGESWSGASLDSAGGTVTAELPTRDDVVRRASAGDRGSPEQKSPAGGNDGPLPGAALASDSEPAADAARASGDGGAEGSGGAPVASAADRAEEFYPIQSLASIRKPDHFDRRVGGGHFRRDQRRGMLAFGIGGEPLPPGMADYYIPHPHGGFGADHFVGGRAGHRPRDYGHGPRRNYDHGRGGGMPYTFHPY